MNALLTTTLLLALANGEDEARALLQKAVSAHGGRAALEAPPPLILRGGAVAFFRSSEFPGSGTDYLADGKKRSERTYTMRGRESDFVQTWDGAEAWSESRGRRSERPARPAQVEANHRPERVLLAALSGRPTLADPEDGTAVIEIEIDGETARVGIDPDDGFISFVEYRYPHQSGLDEMKIKLRRDTYGDWEATTGGFAIARTLGTTLDGVESSRFTVESWESVDALDDELFRLELDLTPPLPSDELAN